MRRNVTSPYASKMSARIAEAASASHRIGRPNRAERNPSRTPVMGLSSIHGLRCSGTTPGVRSEKKTGEANIPTCIRNGSA